MSLDVSTMNTVNGQYSYSTPVLSDKAAILEALSKQLVYYFSPVNLLKDTFLNEVMSLNAGCVPVDILAKFSNIQRIVSSSQIQDSTTDDIPRLLCDAVYGSDYYRQLLRIIVVDQNGQFVAHFGQEYLPSDQCTYFLAIGPTDKLQLEGYQLSSHDATIKNVIILRDVDDQATEDDIRAVFSHSSPGILGIQKDIEHCWFVTLDPSTTKEDIFSILSDLRTQLILGQPVKARLKSQTAPSTLPLDTIKRSEDPSSLNQYPPFLFSDGRKLMNGHATQDGSSNIGKHSHHPGNKGNQPKYQQQHLTDGANGRRSNGMKDQGARSHKHQSRNKRGAHTSSAQMDAHGKDKHTSITHTLSSLGIQDFPSLNEIDSHSADRKEEPSLNLEEEKNIHVESEETASTPLVSPVPARGYAAALLKPAPPTLPMNSSKPVVSTSDSKTPKDSSDSNISSRSSGTAPTDDSSADDKSMSSKPDSEKGSSCNGSAITPMNRTASSSTWSKTSKSFAEVLKN